eukprot:2681264-Prymnesium_polylepis.1
MPHARSCGRVVQYQSAARCVTPCACCKLDRLCHGARRPGGRQAHAITQADRHTRGRARARLTTNSTGFGCYSSVTKN